MFVGVFFRTSNIHTHIHTPFRLFICVKLIISVHGCFTVATVRHKPSPIVAVRANLATRLGSSRSVNFAPTWRPVSDRHDPSTFSGVGVHYLKFTSAIPFRDMTSGMTVGNDS